MQKVRGMKAHQLPGEYATTGNRMVLVESQPMVLQGLDGSDAWLLGSEVLSKLPHHSFQQLLSRPLPSSTSFTSNLGSYESWIGVVSVCSIHKRFVTLQSYSPLIPTRAHPISSSL